MAEVVRLTGDPEAPFLVLLREAVRVGSEPPFSCDKPPEPFFGYDVELAAAVEALTPSTDAAQRCRVYTVVCEPGCGSTSFLRKLAAAFYNPERPVFPAGVFALDLRHSILKYAFCEAAAAVGRGGARDPKAAFQTWCTSRTQRALLLLDCGDSPTTLWPELFKPFVSPKVAIVAVTKAAADANLSAIEPDIRLTSVSQGVVAAIAATLAPHLAGELDALCTVTRSLPAAVAHFCELPASIALVLLRSQVTDPSLLRCWNCDRSQLIPSVLKRLPSPHGVDLLSAWHDLTVFPGSFDTSAVVSVLDIRACDVPVVLASLCSAGLLECVTNTPVTKWRVNRDGGLTTAAHASASPSAIAAYTAYFASQCNAAQQLSDAGFNSAALAWTDANQSNIDGAVQVLANASKHSASVQAQLAVFACGSVLVSRRPELAADVFRGLHRETKAVFGVGSPESVSILSVAATACIGVGDAEAAAIFGREAQAAAAASSEITPAERVTVAESQALTLVLSQATVDISATAESLTSLWSELRDGVSVGSKAAAFLHKLWSSYAALPAGTRADASTHTAVSALTQTISIAVSALGDDGATAQQACIDTLQSLSQSLPAAVGVQALETVFDLKAQSPLMDRLRALDAVMTAIESVSGDPSSAGTAAAVVRDVYRLVHV